ncbi:MAG: aminotransferase DegT [Candidatus Saccharibacteria bacterium]|nr:aminotransferase DegT [Candidatus Saccharibacteria bacterium]
MGKTFVTKSFLPPIDEYKEYVDRIWDNGLLTNQGPLLQEFENKVGSYLSVDNFHFVTNGTLALQLAIRALDISDGEIITTPFSYVATTSAILWEGASPVFVDIDPDTLCIDPDKIEAAITKKTKAILAVHVFGNPCDIDSIEKIAKKHNLKVVYDAAHAFGVEYRGKSLLSYGDISISSFHSTKLFHTIEGGGIVVKDRVISDKIELLKRFGHNGDEHIQLGINAKASEFQAAMGLTNLKYLEDIIDERGRIVELYSKYLKGKVGLPRVNPRVKYNNAYYPVVLKSEEETETILAKLKDSEIFPRRYFYPSLNELPYILVKYNCPVSEDISRRVLCLPLYVGLDNITIRKICEVILG